MRKNLYRWTIMKKILACLMLVPFLAYADCKVIPDGNVNVGWEAYKTPEKVGVKGSFKAVSAAKTAPAESVMDLLKSSSVSIETASVDSKNPGRDAKLVAFFFNQMSGAVIDAAVTSVEGDENQGKLTLDITMNGVKKSVEMDYVAHESAIEAKGVIDLADFNALTALSSINQACYALHQGKTWQDVAIRFELPIKQSCH